MAKQPSKSAKKSKTTKPVKRASNSSQAKIKAEEAELAKLKAENEALKAKVAAKESKLSAHKTNHKVRSFFAGFFAVLAVVGFMLFNISYWTTNTITDTNQFVETTKPLLQNPEINKTLVTEISNTLFEQINLEQELKANLPQNVQFIAAPLASQIQSFTTAKIGEILQSPQAEKVWETILKVSHEQIIAYIENPNNDGVISVNDLYNLAGQDLADSSVGFLFNKDLPDKIATIQVAQIQGVEEARSALNALKSLSLALGLATLISTVLALLLSQRRKKMAIGLAIFSLVMMLSTLLALSIASTQIGNSVAQEYSSAAVSVYQIITAPLVAKTQALALIFAVAIAITALASNLKPFEYIRQNFRKALDWTSSQVVGSWKGNNAFKWIAKNHTLLLWLAVGANFVIFALRLPPTVSGIKNALIGLAISTLIIEVLASISRATSKK